MPFETTQDPDTTVPTFLKRLKLGPLNDVSAATVVSLGGLRAQMRSEICSRIQLCTSPDVSPSSATDTWRHRA